MPKNHPKCTQYHQTEVNDTKGGVKRLQNSPHVYPAGCINAVFQPFRSNEFSVIVLVLPY